MPYIDNFGCDICASKDCKIYEVCKTIDQLKDIGNAVLESLAAVTVSIEEKPKYRVKLNVTKTFEILKGDRSS